MKELTLIQNELNVQKNGHNYSYGRGYDYRKLEDICEGLKPLLEKHKCTLFISDELITVCNLVYICAEVTLTNESGETASAKAFAQQVTSPKGMDVSQATGSASTYARKYALSALFLLGDGKDPDATDAALHEITNLDDLMKAWNDTPETERTQAFRASFTKRKKEIMEGK